MPIDTTTVRVHHEHVLVRPLRESEQTASGLYKPDASRTHQQRGIVVAIGPGELLPSGQVRPIAVAPGDLVLFNKFSGFELAPDSPLLVMRDLEIPVSYAAGTFPLVEHANPDDNHLAGEFCEQCEAAGKAERAAWFAGLARTTATPAPVGE